MTDSTFAEAVRSGAPLLAEGSVFERLRRDPRVTFDPDLAHAALPYDDGGRAALESVHRDYIDAAHSHGLAMVCFTDTWRVNTERLSRSKFSGRSLNEECSQFLCGIRDSYRSRGTVFVGGLTGCKGDSYKPSEALSPDDAFRFHLPQMEALARTPIDFLFASTLPSSAEALGIAHAMATTGLPYILSFVIRSDGTILDGTSLDDAIRRIDSNSTPPPLGYFVNCVHPTVLQTALPAMAGSLARIIGFQGNTSRRSPEEIDGSPELDGQEPVSFGGQTLDAIRGSAVRIVGGCCGTGTEHIAEVARRLRGIGG